MTRRTYLESVIVAVVISVVLIGDLAVVVQIHRFIGRQEIRTWYPLSSSSQYRRDLVVVQICS